MKLEKFINSKLNYQVNFKLKKTFKVADTFHEIHTDLCADLIRFIVLMTRKRFILEKRLGIAPTPFIFNVNSYDHIHLTPLSVEYVATINLPKSSLSSHFYNLMCILRICDKNTFVCNGCYVVIGQWSSAY